MKKLILGMLLGLFMLGGTDAVAMPRYEGPCYATGCGAVSEDGKRAIFTFDEPLDYLYPGNSPTNMVYQWSGGETRALFEFPKGKARGVILHAVSDDARRAIIQTRSPLTEDDTDGFGNDLFAVQDGKPELISWDPADPATKSEARLGFGFARASDDARQVVLTRSTPGAGGFCMETWLRTETSLSRLPTDCQFDHLAGISRDGSSFFTVRDYQVPGWGGLMYWSKSVVRIRAGESDYVTDPTGFPGWQSNVSYLEFGDSTPDGEAVLFASGFPYAPEDQAGDYDVFLRDAAGNYSDLTGDTPPTSGVVDNDRAIGLSTDGTKALFATTRQLVPEDRDSRLDAYVKAVDGPPELVTTGPGDESPEIRNPAFGETPLGEPVLGWRIDASDDLTVFAFDTAQQMVPADTDQSIDVYVRHGSTTELVSTGQASSGGEFDAKLLGISNDGSQVAFTTLEPLVEVDTDNRMDVYARATGQIGRAIDEGASASAISSTRKPERRTKLISAESIAPRMKVTGKPSVSGRRATVRLLCPKSEETGPCRGAVRVRFAGRKAASGSARFRIKAGKGRAVRVKLNRRVMAGKGRATVRITARDGLGNTARSARRVPFR